MEVADVESELVQITNPADVAANRYFNKVGLAKQVLSVLFEYAFI